MRPCAMWNEQQLNGCLFRIAWSDPVRIVLRRLHLPANSFLAAFPILLLALFMPETAGAQPPSALACAEQWTPATFSERMVGLYESSYGGPHQAQYEELLAHSRSVVRIKDIRDNSSGSSLKFAQLTGVFFRSSCHVITNRHGVSVIAKERRDSFHTAGPPPVVQTVRRPALNLAASPVGKVTATVEIGHASGKPISISARVIHAEAMQSENELDGDLAILRLDAALPQAQLLEFIPIDALRREASCTFPAATLGYPIVPKRGATPTMANRTTREIRGLSGELLIADLRCAVGSCAEGSEACDDAILRKSGFKSALVSTCIAAEGGSGSPLYVFDGKGRPLVAGLVTKTVSHANPDESDSAWGIALARGFTQAELERLQAIVTADIRDAGLAGCD